MVWIKHAEGAELSETLGVEGVGVKRLTLSDLKLVVRLREVIQYL